MCMTADPIIHAQLQYFFLSHNSLLFVTFFSLVLPTASFGRASEVLLNLYLSCRETRRTVAILSELLEGVNVMPYCYNSWVGLFSEQLFFFDKENQLLGYWLSTWISLLVSLFSFAALYIPLLGIFRWSRNNPNQTTHFSSGCILSWYQA